MNEYNPIVFSKRVAKRYNLSISNEELCDLGRLSDGKEVPISSNHGGVNFGHALLKYDRENQEIVVEDVRYAQEFSDKQQYLEFMPFLQRSKHPLTGESWLSIVEIYPASIKRSELLDIYGKKGINLKDSEGCRRYNCKYHPFKNSGDITITCIVCKNFKGVENYTE